MLNFLFVYYFLFVNYFFKILLQLCQLYSTGHFIAELIFYQMLKIPSFTDQTALGKECKRR